MNTEFSSEIAQLNDEFRESGNGVVLTSGVQAFEDVLGLLSAVRRFEAFDEDNDPYGEHDFGALDWCGQRIFWKIDYYDAKLVHGEDPLSPECRRILTIMLANEY